MFNTFSENRAVYEIMSKNVVEPERPHMTQYGAYALHAEQARLHARTHAQICNTPFSRQQWFGNVTECYVIRIFPVLFWTTSFGPVASHHQALNIQIRK